jgi:drug/metabolite transporter (DMT)-like permease
MNYKNKKDKNSLVLVYIGLFFSALFWGASFVASKYALRELSPIVIITIRFLIASIIFMPVLIIYARKGRLIAKKDLLKTAFLGLLSVPIYFIFETTALTYTTAMNVGLVIAIIPIVVAILSKKYLSEHFSWKKTIGIIIAFVGTALIITRGTINIATGLNDIIGGALALVAVLAGAAGAILGKKLLQKYPPLLLIGNIMITGTIFTMIISMFMTRTYGVAGLSTAGWISLIYLGVCCSFGAYALFYFALSRLTATKASTTNFIIPLVTVILSIMLLKETLVMPTIIGGLMILVGVFIVMKN